jgi:hypothetical protein
VEGEKRDRREGGVGSWRRRRGEREVREDS